MGAAHFTRGRSAVGVRLVQGSKRINDDQDRTMTTPRPRSTEPLTVSPPIEPLSDSDEFSVISLINTALRHRWWILLFGLLGGAYMAYRSSLMPRLYTTEAQFIPKGSRGQSQIQGIAAQFGLSVPGGDATQSPAFYVDLLQSRPLL